MTNVYWAVMAACIAGGCATVFNGDTKTVQIGGAPGQPIVVDGQQVGMTPMTIAVSNHHSHVISVGGRSCFLNASVGAGWIVADILLTSFIGLIVDAVTGDWDSVDDTPC